MSLNVNQIGTLFGTNAANSKVGVYDLLTGTQDITNSLFNASSLSTSSLISTQTDTLAGLEKFVKDNVTGKDADKLFASIASLRQLFSNNDSDSSADPALSLLAGTGFSKQSGSLIDLFI